MSSTPRTPKRLPTQCYYGLFLLGVWLSLWLGRPAAFAQYSHYYEGGGQSPWNIGLGLDVRWTYLSFYTYGLVGFVTEIASGANFGETFEAGLEFGGRVYPYDGIYFGLPMRFTYMGLPLDPNEDEAKQGYINTFAYTIGFEAGYQWDLTFNDIENTNFRVYLEPKGGYYFQTYVNSSGTTPTSWGFIGITLRVGWLFPQGGYIQYLEEKAAAEEAAKAAEEEQRRADIREAAQDSREPRLKSDTNTNHIYTNIYGIVKTNQIFTNEDGILTTNSITTNEEGDILTNVIEDLSELEDYPFDTNATTPTE